MLLTLPPPLISRPLACPHSLRQPAAPQSQRAGRPSSPGHRQQLRSPLGWAWTRGGRQGSHPSGCSQPPCSQPLTCRRQTTTGKGGGHRAWGCAAAQLCMHAALGGDSVVAPLRSAVEVRSGQVRSATHTHIIHTHPHPPHCCCCSLNASLLTNAGPPFPFLHHKLPGPHALQAGGAGQRGQ